MLLGILVPVLVGTQIGIFLSYPAAKALWPIKGGMEK